MKKMVGLLVAMLLVCAVPVARADTVIFVQGTNDVNPSDPPNPAAVQFAQLFRGSLNTAGNTVVLVNYPATLGWLSRPTQGVGSPTLNDSVAVGVQNLDVSIKAARAASPTGQIDVVGLSQGAVVASQEASNLLAEGYDTSGITFNLAGNPERANGGLATRLPFSVTVPGVLTVGGTEFAAPPPSTGVQVVNVTNQFDPFADAPAYLLNPVAVANWLVALAVALAGSDRPPMLSNQHDYASTSPTDPTAIVATSGTLSDVLIPSPVGQLPLTQPLLLIGVPRAYVVALDPFLRAVIMTAYPPTTDPAERVTFRLLPPVSAWGSDVSSVVAGAAETTHLLEQAVLGSRTAPARPVKHSAPASILNDVLPVRISTAPARLNAQTPLVNASPTSPTHLTLAKTPAYPPQSTMNPDVTSGDEQKIRDPKVASSTDSWAATRLSPSTPVARKPTLPRVRLHIGSNPPNLKAARRSGDGPVRNVLNDVKRGQKASTGPAGST